MIILAIDSANFSTSIAVQKDNKIVAYAENKTVHSGDTILLPMIESAFKEASLSLQAISHITVTLGPGSFTGTRVGIAAARGFSLALEAPILGINSFEWVAHTYQKKFSSHSPVLVALDSKREESFVSLFSPSLTVLKTATYLRPAQLHNYREDQETRITGNAAHYLSPQHISWMPDARDLASYALDKLTKGGSFEGSVPFYLRPPEMSLARK